jgi:4-amino-4-deoxy-L-arabinose transferase-like glycosyltransferase
MIGPRDALIDRAVVGFILSSSAALTKAARTAAQYQMDRQNVGPLEQLVLGNQDCRLAALAGSGVNILAPGNQVHSKGAPDPRDL